MRVGVGVGVEDVRLSYENERVGFIRDRSKPTPQNKIYNETTHWLMLSVFPFLIFDSLWKNIDSTLAAIRLLRWYFTM